MQLNFNYSNWKSALLNFSAFQTSCIIIPKTIMSFGVNQWQEFVFLGAHLSKHVTDKLEFSQQYIKVSNCLQWIEPRVTCSNYHLDYLIESEQASERPKRRRAAALCLNAIDWVRSAPLTSRVKRAFDLARRVEIFSNISPTDALICVCTLRAVIDTVTVLRLRDEICSPDCIRAQLCIFIVWLDQDLR